MARKKLEDQPDALFPKYPDRDKPQSMESWKGEQAETIDLPIRRGKKTIKRKPNGAAPTARKHDLKPKTIPKKLPKPSKV